MKRTSVLKILHDTSFPVNKLVIHPNTGFDLGFMQVKYVTNIFINTKVAEFSSGSAAAFCEAEVHLKNECRAEVLEMGNKLWDRMGRPDKAILIYDQGQNRLLIAT